MCAQFTLKIKATDLSLKYGIKLPENLEDIDERFLPYKTAPVIVEQNEVQKLVAMQFSLVPSWSKDSKVKFATHNARIETVTEKPTWKIPFDRFHCIIPMTSFYESAYEGPEAGHIIEFSQSQDELLFAAGIFDVWSDTKENKNLFSFSILTTEPDQFIIEHGHDRTPIFLKYSDAKVWLTLKDQPQKMIEFLKDKNLKPELKVKIDRPLKAGWEKRK